MVTLAVSSGCRDHRRWLCPQRHLFAAPDGPTAPTVLSGASGSSPRTSAPAGTRPAHHTPSPHTWLRLGGTHVVHHLLEALAERTPSDACDTLLGLREGDRPNAGRHPKLFHHGVGNAGDLPQVVLCPWSVESEKEVLPWSCRSGAPPALTAEVGPQGTTVSCHWSLKLKKNFLLCRKTTQGFPGGPVLGNPPANVGGTGSIPGPEDPTY